ncbi:MAG: hypothetical protein HY270_24535 [Deltaproteobacteria bacterium]|nr:hypothetical protein [Deltaproteobacteria bacterium]
MLHCEFDPHASVPEWARRDVYRIAQEAITNAVRHGAPTRIDLCLQPSDGGTRFEVADNGVGFSLNTVTLGTGIRGMRERAAAIGAELRLETTVGKGTCVLLILPQLVSELGPPHTPRSTQ